MMLSATNRIRALSSARLYVATNGFCDI